MIIPPLSNYVFPSFGLLHAFFCRQFDVLTCLLELRSSRRKIVVAKIWTKTVCFIFGLKSSTLSASISRLVLWHGMSLKVERLKDEVRDVPDHVTFQS